jgi:putative Mn2+ efflux pump MntP
MIPGSSGALLVFAVAAVGVFHTLVPDHWAPIAVLARQRGWSTMQVSRAAALAGIGHAISTLIIAAVVWVGGAVLAAHYGQFVSTVSSIALIGFGLWLCIASIREMRSHDEHSHFGHAHVHRHDGGPEHRHWHEHHAEDWHDVSPGDVAAAHEHGHQGSSRTALLLILGSSPMIEGIPAFFSASRFGVGLLFIMAAVFALSTIVTYVAVTVGSLRAMQALDFGPIERYGEVVSGGLIALLGAVFLAFPQL